MPREGRYAGRVVVVTGARRGVGRVIASHFLAQGARVVGLGRGGDDTLAHDSYQHLVVDVRDDQAVRRAFTEVGRRHGRLDVLVNGAGVLTAQYVLLLPAGRAEEMVQTNLLGVLAASREAAKLMARRKYGRIINLGSMAAVLQPAGDSVYAATKAAVVAMTGVMAREWGPLGITVNTLGITAFPTDMLAQVAPDKLAEVIAGLPIPRMATPEDIVNVVDFLASEASDYVTAQTIYLGGVHS